MRTYLLVVFLASFSATEAEEAFAKASFPPSLMAELERGERSASSIEEVQLTPLAMTERDKLIARFARPSPPATSKILPMDQTIVCITPFYPRPERSARISGFAAGYAVVTQDGEVSDIYVKYTQPNFGKAAALALKFWRFKPRDSEGLAVAHMPFNIDGETNGSRSDVAECSNPMLRKELLDRMGQDQKVRHELIRSSSAERKSELLAQMTAMDSDNTQRIKAIVEQYGWPSPELVGADGVLAAFIFVQHSVDFDFQKQTLPLVRTAYLANKLPADCYAILVDRVLVRQGKPQIYGSQVKPVSAWKGNIPVLEPIDDEPNVDKRRAELGMIPLSEYLLSLTDLYLPENN